MSDRGEAPPIPPELVIPAWLALLVGGAIATGSLFGALSAELAPLRLTRAGFYGAAFGYLAVSLVDFREHLRLEKAATGRYLACTAIPPGETLNHAATLAVLVATLAFGRPPGQVLALRDGFVLVAPMLFLALGWRDELVYHRRRARHREDLMHTVAHLAAGAMMASFVAARMIDWPQLAR